MKEYFLYDNISLPYNIITNNNIEKEFIDSSSIWLLSINTRYVRNIKFKFINKISDNIDNDILDFLINCKSITYDKYLEHCEIKNLTFSSVFTNCISLHNFPDVIPMNPTTNLKLVFVGCNSITNLGNMA